MEHLHFLSSFYFNHTDNIVTGLKPPILICLSCNNNWADKSQWPPWEAIDEGKISALNDKLLDFQLSRRIKSESNDKD